MVQPDQSYYRALHHLLLVQPKHQIVSVVQPDQPDWSVGQPGHLNCRHCRVASHSSGLWVCEPVWILSPTMELNPNHLNLLTWSQHHPNHLSYANCYWEHRQSGQRCLCHACQIRIWQVRQV
jgi:hypothetical protein